jgi:predicted DNA binding CopG/RHH family protein
MIEIKKSKRNNEVKIRLDSEEMEKLERKAENLGLKLSQYIRLVSVKANLNINTDRG